MSFSIKASHKFANQSATPDVKPESSYLEYSLSSLASLDKEKTPVYPPVSKKDSEVVSGSGNGMAVRTSVTAMPDYY